MKILVLGGGLMGPAAAYCAMRNPRVTQVIICDRDEAQLRHSINQLNQKEGASKLGVIRLDLHTQTEAVEVLARFDAAVAALPQAMGSLAAEIALQAGTPLVDLSMPYLAELADLRHLAALTGGVAVMGCGLEPGLTEIMTRHLADQLDRVDEVHIKCGGIPHKPEPPLGYKIVFGGQQLPLTDVDARMVANGQLIPVPRYSGVEAVEVLDVGICEAWHEGFMPWLLELPTLQNLRAGTQKTIRWPGFAAKVTVLKEMGLLSKKPIQVNGVSLAPKKMLDALLYPHVKMIDSDQDIAILRVEITGLKDGQPRMLRATMVDRFDPQEGFTAMARTTAFTGAIVAQMLADGSLAPQDGIYHPEKLISGSLLQQLLAGLAQHNITFEITERPLEKSI